MTKQQRIAAWRKAKKAQAKAQPFSKVPQQYSSVWCEHLVREIARDELPARKQTSYNG